MACGAVTLGLQAPSIAPVAKIEIIVCRYLIFVELLVYAVLVAEKKGFMCRKDTKKFCVMPYNVAKIGRVHWGSVRCGVSKCCVAVFSGGIKTEKDMTSRHVHIRYLCFQSNKLRFW